ncbi:MAG: HD domain-containing protein [Bacteroidales bacterium]
MDFDGAKKYVFSRMKNELSRNLHYHSIDHTKDVMSAIEKLAEMENVSEHDKELLLTGALFHDLGFVITYDGHENASINLAQEILPGYEYTEDEIKIIEGLIRATEIPQTPTNHLEKIMSDADLDYLGRDDLFVIGQRLQYEWKLYGKVSTLRDWHKAQLEFLKKHKYFTDSARKIRDKKKEENILELEKLLCYKK